jgi:hypothetical protein
MTRIAAGLVMAVALAAVAPEAGRASDELAGKLDGLADRIAKLLEEEKATALSVGEFTGPGNLETNAGPGIQRALIQALQAKKVTVKPGAPLSIKGEYLLVKDRSDKDRDRRLIRISAVVRDDSGDEKLRFTADVRGNADIAKFVAATATLDHKARADAGDRNEALSKQIRKPGAVLDGTKIKAGAGGKYAVEFLRDGKPVRPEVKDGQAFVPIRKGETYALRVHNTTGLEAGVSVTIDGLDVFTFSQVKNEQGKPRYSHFILAPRSASVIRGWHDTNKSAHSFKVVELKDSAVAKVVQDAGLLRGNPALGTVTICFHIAWEGKMPAEEEGARDAGGATGIGPPVRVDLKEVRRSIGVLREVISVRYQK